MSEDSEHYINRMVRHRIGTDALQRIRHLVDDENEKDRLNARWARRIMIALACWPY